MRMEDLSNSSATRRSLKRQLRLLRDDDFVGMRTFPESLPEDLVVAYLDQHKLEKVSYCFPAGDIFGRITNKSRKRQHQSDQQIFSDEKDEYFSELERRLEQRLEQRLERRLGRQLARGQDELAEEFARGQAELARGQAELASEQAELAEEFARGQAELAREQADVQSSLSIMSEPYIDLCGANMLADVAKAVSTLPPKPPKGSTSESTDAKSSPKRGTMTKLTQKVASLGLASSSTPAVEQHGSTLKLQRNALNFTDYQFQCANVPEKLRDKVRNFGEVMKERNHAAHMTHVKFAKLLTSPKFVGGKYYNEWKDFFPILHSNKTIEDVAASNEEDVAESNE